MLDALFVVYVLKTLLFFRRSAMVVSRFLISSISILIVSCLLFTLNISSDSVSLSEFEQFEEFDEFESLSDSLPEIESTSSLIVLSAVLLSVLSIDLIVFLIFLFTFLFTWLICKILLFSSPEI